MRASVLCVLALAACESATEAGPVGAPAVEPAESIAVRVGGREVRVRCRATCDLVRDEMTRLHRECIVDPMSTAHHVSTSAAMISLGCCTEADGTYAEACGIEGLESCVSRWSAECSSGRLSSDRPSSDGPSSARRAP